MISFRDRTLLVSAVVLLLLTTSFNVATSKNENKNITELKEKINNNLIEKIIDLRIRLIMMLGHFPSISACVIKGDEIVWYEGYGFTKKLPREKPTPDTIYPIGSVSKTVTATAIMQLWERGLFDLDDNVNDYLDFDVRNPNYPDTNVTFRMLLAHHSSLTEKEDINYWYLSYVYFLHKNDYPYPIIKEMITAEGKFFKDAVWKDFEPGTRKSYSNINYILLEHLVEVLSGQSFSDYCYENIFEPLEMYNTSFYFNDLRDKELARSYHFIGPIYFRYPYVDIGAGFGGLKTSINDFSHYAMAYINDGEWNGVRLLDNSTIDLILTIQFKNASNYSRNCLGWQYFGGFQSAETYGHVGHAPGGSGAIFLDPNENYAEIFFINRYIQYKTIRDFISWFSLLSYLREKTKEV